MSDARLDKDEMPEEVDFRKGKRGLHHIPPESRVLMPAAIEKSVWAYYSVKAAQQGIPLSELLTEVLQRDIEVREQRH
jgi:hypothetical protein